MKSFSSVMLSVEICYNDLFAFSVSTLTFFQSWFPRDGNVLLLLYSLRVFHTGVWITIRLLKSPGLFSVFWPILKIQLFGWSQLVLLFLTLPDPVRSPWGPFQAHKLQLILLSLLSLFLTSFFSSALSGGLSLGSEWLKVSSDHQDFPRYSGRS